MISKTSRAACLAELTSNPKSFFNCPDLHGGVPACSEVDFDLGSPGPSYSSLNLASISLALGGLSPGRRGLSALRGNSALASSNIPSSI